MMRYVIYITNENGERVMASNVTYRTYSEACEVSEKMRRENPACEARAIKVMRKD